MRSKFGKASQGIALGFILCFLASSNVIASELASTANIYLFPQPRVVSNMLLTTTAGKKVSLQDFRGKVVLLHFWSISCPACKMEEPILDQLRQKLGSSGLEILGVNLVDSPQAVAFHASSNRMPFPVLSNGGTGFTLKSVNMGSQRTTFVVNPLNEAILEVPAFPTTYILDCSGSAVGFSVGVARWNHSAAQVFLQGLLSDRKKCSTVNDDRRRADSR